MRAPMFAPLSYGELCSIYFLRYTHFNKTKSAVLWAPSTLAKSQKAATRRLTASDTNQLFIKKAGHISTSPFCSLLVVLFRV